MSGETTRGHDDGVQVGVQEPAELLRYLLDGQQQARVHNFGILKQQKGKVKHELRHFGAAMIIHGKNLVFWYPATKIFSKKRSIGGKKKRSIGGKKKEHRG